MILIKLTLYHVSFFPSIAFLTQKPDETWHGQSKSRIRQMYELILIGSWYYPAH